MGILIDRAMEGLGSFFHHDSPATQHSAA
ncbi:hypothetical protein CGCF245_v015734 [Colletotrichum fructicola]|nr:hypothetical protein CGCF245_v015734 [Colletotrichum fructicola]